MRSDAVLWMLEIHFPTFLGDLMKNACCACLSILVLLPVLAYGQQNVGSLIEMGGKKLSKDELQALVPGSKIEFVGQGSANFILEPKNGGTLGGLFRSPFMSMSTTGTGTWNVSDEGKFCFDITYSTRRSPVQNKRCVFLFKQGESYWASGSDTDPAAGITKYSISGK